MSILLEVDKLKKRFGAVQAVDGVSFAITEGSCFGFLGPNGAGKTTTLEIIEGITKADNGDIIYRGIRNNPKLKSEAGIQFQSTALMDYLTVMDVLRLFAKLYPKTVSLDQLIEQCRLEDFLHQRPTTLSGGQRQRVLLAIALINDPAIVFLDEPTTGLDPQARRNVWELIRGIKAQGKTLILTTHYMDEAEQLCDQLAIIDGGKIIAEGSPQNLLAEHFDHSFITLDREEIDEKQLDGLSYEAQQESWVIRANSVEETLNRLIEHSVALTSLRVRSPSLDDLFIKLTGHHLRE